MQEQLLKRFILHSSRPILSTH